MDLLQVTERNRVGIEADDLGARRLLYDACVGGGDGRADLQ